MALTGATINERFAQRIAATPDLPAWYAKHEGGWRSTTWREFGRLSHAFAAGLMEYGHKPKETIAVLGDTREEWSICDLGGLALGAAVTGVYPTFTPDQAGYVVEHCDATTLVVQNQEQLDKMLSAKSTAKSTAKSGAKPRATKGPLAKVQRIVCWDPVVSDDDRVVQYSDIIAKGSEIIASQPTKIAELAAEVQPDDPAMTIYTSGTTGPPKGAVITHANVVFKIQVMRQILPADEKDVSFAFLPMAHVAERVIGAMTRIELGYPAYFAQSLLTVIQDVADAKPTIFGSVPRIFEKAYAKIQHGLGEATGIKKVLMKWAIGLAHEKSRAGQEGKSLGPWKSVQFGLADKLVLSKIRAIFGGRVKFFISGAAPIASEILEFFDGCGLVTYEVYGMTESTGLITANRQNALKLGTVGKSIPGSELKLAEDGEILCKGPQVFAGYYKNPDATAETIIDGWLHTGDVGAFDSEGYLTITGRKKEIAITAGGKNISPANIENLVKQDPIISQALVHADRRKFPCALITLDPEAAPEWAKSQGLPTDLAKLAGEPKLIEHIERHLEEVNKELSPVEQIKRWKVLNEDFTVDNGMLTPTMKIKRNVIEERFADVLDAFYQ